MSFNVMQTRGRGVMKQIGDKSSPRQPGKTAGKQTNTSENSNTNETNFQDLEQPSCDDLERKVQQIHSDLWDDENGIHTKLKSISSQNQHYYEEISNLRAENAQLRRDLDLLRSVVIRIDRRMLVMDNDITDLRTRSMRDNILIHNFPYTQDENLSVTMPETIKRTLGVDVEFVIIHRNGIRGVHNGKPVTITAKLADRAKKEEILNAQKAKKIARQRLPFFITPQQPPVVVSNKNKIYDKANSLQKQSISAKVKRDQIILGDGSSYQEEVPLIRNSDALQITSEETQALDEIQITSVDPIIRDGSEFSAAGAKAQTTDEVRDIYRKICVDPYVASANSRILVYRIRAENDKIIENYHDDDEHGAGRRLLKYMQENAIINAAIVVTRWIGDGHIGPQRFTIMETLVNQVANALDDA